MKEIKPNQPRPSEELLEKVRCIAYTKSMVGQRYRGEFNRFGVYVQSKDIYEQDSDKTIYMAGGKFISKLKFMDFSGNETIVNKYESGDWEEKLDLLYKFTQEFQEKYKGQDYP